MVPSAATTRNSNLGVVRQPEYGRVLLLLVLLVASEHTRHRRKPRRDLELPHPVQHATLARVADTHQTMIDRQGPEREDLLPATAGQVDALHLDAPPTGGATE
jgi:hypothetical protein